MYVVWGKEIELMNEYALDVFLLSQTEMILLCYCKQNMNLVDCHGQAKFGVLSTSHAATCGCHLLVQL